MKKVELREQEYSSDSVGFDTQGKQSNAPTTAHGPTAHHGADVKPAAIQNLQATVAHGASKRKQWQVKNEPGVPNAVTPVTRKKRIPQAAAASTKVVSAPDAKDGTDGKNGKRADRSPPPRHNFRGRNQAPTSS